MESLIKSISSFGIERSARRIPLKYSRVLHFTLLTALVAVLTSIFVYIDSLATKSEYESVYRDTSDDLDLVRARLEGNINSSLQTAQGLMAAISVEPDMHQQRFSQFAQPLFESVHALRNVSAAPDLIIRYVYPVAGNDRAIGLNLATSENQRDAALLASETGQMVVAGPVNLAQGGTAFVGRIPVFVFNADGERRLWGLISAVIDVDKLYAMSGLPELQNKYDVAIRGRDGKGENGETFFGDMQVFNKKAVLQSVTLPGFGSWQIAVIPKKGWPTAAVNAWKGRVAALMFVIIVVSWAYAFMRMLRQQYEKDIRLNDLFFRSPLGLALNDYKSGQFIDVNPALAEMTGYSVDEFKELTFRDITPEDQLAIDAQQLKNLDDTGSFGPYEKDHFHKDGHRIPVLIHGTLVKDMNGAVLVWSIIENISDQKAARDALSQHQQRLELVIKSTAVGMWDWDVGSSEIQIDARWAEMVGYKVEELQPFSLAKWFSLIEPTMLEQNKTAMKRYFTGEIDHYISEVRLRHKLGHWVWVLSSGRIVEWNTNGTPVRMVGTHIDISQQKNAQETMAQLRSELQRFFDLSVNIMAIRDGRGRFEAVNKASETILGYSQEEILSMELINIVHPDDKEATLLAKKNLIDGNIGSQRVAYRLRNKSGNYVNLLWSSSIDPHSGKIYSSAIDITDQVNAEQKLRRQTELLENIGNQAIIGAWEVDLETKQVYWSSVIKKIHEVPDDFEPDFDSHINYVASEKYLREFEKAMRRCVKHREPFQIEYEILTHKKNNVWVTMQAQGEYQGSRCARVFGYMQDISDRKLNQERLVQAHAELEQQMSLVETIAYAQSNFISSSELQAPFNILLKDILHLTKSAYGFIGEIHYQNDGRPYLQTHVMVDPSADVGANGSEEAIVSSHIFNNMKHLLSAATLKLEPMLVNNVNVASMLDRLKSDNSTLFSYMGVPIVSAGRGIGLIGLANRPNGYDMDMLTWLQPLITTVGQIIGSVRAVRARDAMQAQLIEAKLAAEQAANAKSEFLATMSHEIRTPLNGVIGMVSLLGRSQLDDKQQRQVSIAKTSAEALLALINDILDFSKVDAGRLELESVEINLHSMLGSFAETMALRAQEKNVELVLDLHQLTTPNVKGDPVRILQIFTNLVSNAIKFTHSGEVVVACGSVDLGNQVKLVASIQDTGIGIPTDKIEQLFQPFTQADSSTTRNYGGTGLGLAICKKLCTSMQGKIAVSSEVDKGSCFEFQVRLKKSSTPQHRVANDLLAARSVLVLDVNRTSRGVLRRQLESWGATVTTAGSIHKALQLLDVNATEWTDTAISKLDLILVDQRIYRQDETCLLNILTKHPHCRDARTAIMTDLDFNEPAGNLGFDFNFPKPATVLDLLKAVAPLSSEIARQVQKYMDLTLTQQDVTTPAAKAVAMREDLQPSVWPADTRVLLVEDNLVNVEVALMMLSDLGVNADVAGNGIEALQILNSSTSANSYSAILMDCQMPELDGYEATRRIRSGEAGQRWVDVPIIAMTANAFESDREKCLSAGMNDYLAKPVDEYRLASMLRKWIKSAEYVNEGKPIGEHFDLSNSTDKKVGLSKPRSDLDCEWDIESALKLVKGKTDRLGMLLQLFCDNADDRHEMFNNAVDAEDFDQVRLAAHSIKGSAGQFCVKNLQKCAAELEQAAKHGDLTTIKSLQPEFNLLFSSTMNRFKSYLDSGPIS